MHRSRGLGPGRTQLLHGALFGLLVRTPAQEPGAVAEAPAGKMIVLEFADQLRLERNPFGIAVVARPAAGAAGSLAGKPALAGRQLFRGISRRAGDERLQNRLQLLAVVAGEAGAEANMVELAAA